MEHGRGWQEFGNFQKQTDLERLLNEWRSENEEDLIAHMQLGSNFGLDQIYISMPTNVTLRCRFEINLNLVLFVTLGSLS